MSGIHRFEDIEAWQKARELTKAIYVLPNDGQFACGFGLRDQIRRTSVFIMTNIAEGGLLRHLQNSDFKGAKYK
jgi:four helix bundle protein